MSILKNLTGTLRKPLNPKINRNSPLGAITIAAWPISNIGIQGDPTSGFVYDIAGRGYKGTATDLSLDSTPYGFGINFGTGDTENISIQDQGNTPIHLIKSEEFTFMTLIKFSAVDEEQVIFEAKPSGNNGWTFSILSDGTLEFKTNNLSNGKTVTGATSLSADEWYRLGFSVGSGSDPTVAIYLNGIEDANSLGGQGIGTGGINEVTVGKPTHTDTLGLNNAVITDIIAYNRFISEAEASYEYRNLFDHVYQGFAVPLSSSNTFTEVGSGGILSGGSHLISKETSPTIDSIGVLINGTPTYNSIFNIIPESIGSLANGNSLISSSINEIASSNGVVLNGVPFVELVPATPAGIMGGGAAIVGIQPAVSGGSVINGSNIVGITQSVSGGVILNGKILIGIQPAVSGGSLIGGTHNVTSEYNISNSTNSLVNGAAIVGIQPAVSGGSLIGGAAIVGIQPAVSGGSLIGGTHNVTSEYNISNSTNSLVNGAAIVGIQPAVSGGNLAGGEAFNFITEIGIGGSIVGGIGYQTYYEEGTKGTLISGNSISYIDYNGSGGIKVGGSAQRSTIIHDYTDGGIKVGGSAQRSTIVHEYTYGGIKVRPVFLFHYYFTGGTTFDDTVSYGGPITIGGEATVVRPTIRFIGNGSVIINGDSEEDYAFSDYSFESQTPVSTPVVIQGESTVLLTINDQTCVSPAKPCRISDIQTGMVRNHCTSPQIFASYCGDLRKDHYLCGSNSTALLPAIVACRQKQLRNQDILDIKNKTTLRNRGKVV